MLKRLSAEPFHPVLLLCLLVLGLLFVSNISINTLHAQEEGSCIIPESGPWPPCATGDMPPSPSTPDCVIPPSGPWPPCATGANPSPPKADCIIPPSGPWPPCATGSGGMPAPPNTADCIIPPSGPWPPCATGGGSGQPTNTRLPDAINLSVVGTGYAQPVFLTHAGDGRIFVVEKIGRIRELNSNSTYLDISGRVNSSGAEQGLLSLAFHPNFKQNGRAFIYYINDDGNTVVAELAERDGTLDPRSEQRILSVSQPFANHNGGQIAFGKDGMLYIGLGDGGGAGDPLSNGLDKSTLHGSILRIDINGAAPYAIPNDNPFLRESDSRGEIWAYGLRNPWRFSFDRSTGDLYIGDVGQDQREEISFAPAGRGGQNFGWNAWEGTFCFVSGCREVVQTPPIAEYAHDAGCSVTGGYVYRGSNLPALTGVYFYGDFCSGSIWATRKPATGPWQSQLVLESDIPIGSFGEDAAGELYVLGVDGTIYKFTR